MQILKLSLKRVWLFLLESARDLKKRSSNQNTADFFPYILQSAFWKMRVLDRDYPHLFYICFFFLSRSGCKCQQAVWPMVEWTCVPLWRYFPPLSTVRRTLTDFVSHISSNNWMNELDFSPFSPWTSFSPLCRKNSPNMQLLFRVVAWTMAESASLNRTYRLFRTLGLRHLCVVNHHNQVRGR